MHYFCNIIAIILVNDFVTMKFLLLNDVKKMCNIKKSFIGLVFSQTGAILRRGDVELRLLSWLVPVVTSLITLHVNCKIGL